jgi:hypothetical protein
MIVIECPHCNALIEIESINCGIFRHGQYKNTNHQLPPHSSKEVCDTAFEQGLIYGCGKPFSIRIENNNIIVAICDYI